MRYNHTKIINEVYEYNITHVQLSSVTRKPVSKQHAKNYHRYQNMVLITAIDGFWGGPISWIAYLERLELFFEINHIRTDPKKRAVLITALDDKVYKTLRDLCHPLLPKEKTYLELVELLNKQFPVRKFVFRERNHFYAAQQDENETIPNWFARVKNLSVECKFGEHSEDIIRDLFICGLRTKCILERLCEEDENVSLHQAVEIALREESSSILNS